MNANHWHEFETIVHDHASMERAWFREVVCEQLRRDLRGMGAGIFSEILSTNGSRYTHLAPHVFTAYGSWFGGDEFLQAVLERTLRSLSDVVENANRSTDRADYIERCPEPEFYIQYLARLAWVGEMFQFLLDRGMIRRADSV